MNELFSLDRDVEALERFIEDGKIAPRLVEIRGDFARSEALRHFFDAKSEGDFYIEDILNSFIASVQYPVNFAIFKKQDHGLHFVAHFCTDKEHEDAFNRRLQCIGALSDEEATNSMFRLFPHILADPHYLIAVYHMDTKMSEFELIRPNLTCFPDTASGVSAYNPFELSIDNSLAYIASSADHFFQFKWDVFASEFGESAKSYLLSSLSKLASNQKPWDARASELVDALKQDAYPEEEGGSGSQAGRDAWKDQISRTFGAVLDGSTDGINLVSSMMKAPGTQDRSGENPIYPPNMLLAFRTFSREPAEARHALHEDRHGYQYDTSFLISDGVKEQFSALLNKLKTEFLSVMSQADSNFCQFADTFEGAKRSRCVYSNIFVERHKDDHLHQTLSLLDQDFWQQLSSKNGITKCIEILASWVGSQVRSLVDPVYHTGLVHTNHLFERGGLDRVGILCDLQINSIDDIPTETLNDARRVVILYYVLSELADWNGRQNYFDPTQLAAVLVPIKMRGSVWGVTIHGVYTSDYQKIFADQRYWLGYFKLTTDHRQKNAQVFDRYLWNLAESHVSDLLLKHISSALMREKVSEGIRSEIDEVNRKLRRVERNSPFALPQFRFQARGTAEGSGDMNAISYPPAGATHVELAWTILDNCFFTAHQEWDQNSTRNFKRVVEHGVMRAANAAAAARGIYLAVNNDKG